MLLLTWLAAGQALAEEPAPADDPRAAAEPRASKAKKAKKAPTAEASSRFGHLQPKGRLFVSAALERHSVSVVNPAGATQQENVDSFDVSIRSARAGLFYQAPVNWLTAEVELEFTDDPELKDAWLKGRWEHLGAKVGQFKLPFSAIEMDSSFTLPLADRGLLLDLLVDELQIAGRRPGLAVEVRGSGKVRPSLTLGTFQGSVLVSDDPDDRDVDLLDKQGLSSQSFAARGELKVADFVFGAAYEHRIGSPALLVTKYYPTAGADMLLDMKLGRAGLRIWFEGMVGSSWLENWYKPPDGRDATFLAARLLTAVRFGGLRKGQLYVEPYGMLGILDPDNDVLEDIASEEVLGVNVGLWKLARVGLEAEVEHVQRNFPQTYYLGDDPDRVALVLQAGAEF